jgi:hypothetical protein
LIPLSFPLFLFLVGATLFTTINGPVYYSFAFLVCFFVSLITSFLNEKHSYIKLIYILSFFIQLGCAVYGLWTLLYF